MYMKEWVKLIFPLFLTQILRNFLFHGATAPSGLGPPYYRDLRSHLGTPQSVGLLLTSGQLDAENST
jgi:hypothetical protein